MKDKIASRALETRGVLPKARAEAGVLRTRSQVAPRNERHQATRRGMLPEIEPVLSPFSLTIL
jgi:hypothetical protein